MRNLKLSCELELNKLSDIIEERDRLINILHISPSTNDNIKLKTVLNRILDIFNSLDHVANEDDMNDFTKFIKIYNNLLNRIPKEMDLQNGIENNNSNTIDTSLYEFNKQLKLEEEEEEEEEKTISPLKSSINDGPVIKKKVRLNDEITYKEYTPYTDNPDHDDDDDDDAGNRNKLMGNATDTTSSNNTKDDLQSYMVSNEEIFARQQQQLMEQDSHLDTLSGSVQRTHGISLDINNELVSQNNEVLNDLENLIENGGRNLDRAKRRLEIFEKTARDNGPCSIIVLLILILFFLLIVL
ncbi:syntaxin NDAI_0H02440 [Naumovozyma dairenensis CBS 421]|uniref:t-SNARE coiled-coil homology domain-containing protein n=1 Tax=Naumovozyma dairenensis (strain ATCC 10597 / BCRC 20456 / CBS 421 / NBRC 0211 / NRRL Y-12639) TaxID=1071378 RepID=G0WF57_NAUDC|nr:hypothetical protein NDAI_0H02440 [Naumovozyma dairenensis CBS 421]CCD26418.1 hypothetical protein NDAI_0H02440 [Naumovozyma dairenensis CBS 421]